MSELREKLLQAGMPAEQVDTLLVLAEDNEQEQLLSLSTEEIAEKIPSLVSRYSTAYMTMKLNRGSLKKNKLSLPSNSNSDRSKLPSLPGMSSTPAPSNEKPEEDLRIKLMSAGMQSEHIDAILLVGDAKEKQQLQDMSVEGLKGMVPELISRYCTAELTMKFNRGALNKSKLIQPGSKKTSIDAPPPSFKPAGDKLDSLSIPAKAPKVKEPTAPPATTLETPAGGLTPPGGGLAPPGGGLTPPGGGLTPPGGGLTPPGGGLTPPSGGLSAPGSGLTSPSLQKAPGTGTIPPPPNPSEITSPDTLAPPPPPLQLNEVNAHAADLADHSHDKLSETLNPVISGGAKADLSAELADMATSPANSSQNKNKQKNVLMALAAGGLLLVTVIAYAIMSAMESEPEVVVGKKPTPKPVKTQAKAYVDYDIPLERNALWQLPTEGASISLPTLTTKAYTLQMWISPADDGNFTLQWGELNLTQSATDKLKISTNEQSIVIPSMRSGKDYHLCIICRDGNTEVFINGRKRHSAAGMASGELTFTSAIIIDEIKLSKIAEFDEDFSIRRIFERDSNTLYFNPFESDLTAYHANSKNKIEIPGKLLEQSARITELANLLKEIRAENGEEEEINLD